MQRATSILPTAGNALAYTQQQRGMATIKQISMRLKSVKNIQKITASMKMVSAAKYTRAERDLRQCRPYGEGSKQFYEKAEVSVPEEQSKKLYLAITSDRGKHDTCVTGQLWTMLYLLGLCGGVHTGVARQIRAELALDPSIKIFCVGDKSRTILQRLWGKNIIMVAHDVSGKVLVLFRVFHCVTF